MPKTGGGIDFDDPLHLAMHGVVNSPAGIAAASKAAAEGIPPICGVDKLLREIIVNYGPERQATLNAGYIVAEMMRGMGYTEGAKHQKCPSGCVVKTGTVWIAPVPK